MALPERISLSGRQADHRLCYNTDAGMPEDEAHLLMQHRFDTLNQQLNVTLPWYAGLSVERKEVLFNMTFQPRFEGLMKFRKALAAMSRGDFEAAAKEMLDSKWARSDSPDRVREVAKIMRTGAYTPS